MNLSTKFAVIITLVLFANLVLSILFLSIFTTVINPSQEVLKYFNTENSILVFMILTIPEIITGIVIWKFLDLFVVDPISRMKRTTKIIASGNLSQKIESLSEDEIGELGAYINMVIKNLAGALQGMANSLRDTKKKESELTHNVEKLEEARRVAVKAMDDLNIERLRLLEAKAKDEALLASIGDGVIATDAYGKIIFINTEAQSLLGVTDSDVTNKSFADIVKIKDSKDGPIHPSTDSIIIGKTLGGSRTSGTYYFFNLRGEIFPVSLISSPVIAGNTIVGAILIFRDITHELEVDRMKTEFISLASHQLRTPLSALRWFSEMLLDGTVGEITADQRELAQNINLSAGRMVDLVNSLLNISRIESGRIIIDPIPTDIQELIDGVVKDLGANLKHKNQKVEVKIIDDLPKVNLDPKLVRQVYLNLLSNAIKYSPEKSTIEVKVFKKDEDMISEVVDQGYGIPASQHDKVFQKFFRADNIVKRVTDGTGLGLYLVKAIVESSHGKIGFDSKEDKGTTFWFSLPLSGMQAKAGEVTIDS